MSNAAKIVIGIPGKWPNRTAIVEAIAKESAGYLFAGTMLMHIESKWSCALEIYERDPQLRLAFQLAGGARFDEATLDEIESHSYTLYLSCEGGSLSKARELMKAADAVLRCGGLAVKVESSGVAHTAKDWQTLAADEQTVALMHAFVTYIGSENQYYSCGMHALGFRDTIVKAGISPDEAANLLYAFNAYIALENANVGDGESFSLDAASPRFELREEPCGMYPAEDLFHNPYGVWRLAPA